MSFDKFRQLQDAINAYGQHIALSGISDPTTTLSHLMCMELLRDLKAERDAPAAYPGLVVRLDYKGKHMSLSLSDEMLSYAEDKTTMAADHVRRSLIALGWTPPGVH